MRGGKLVLRRAAVVDRKHQAPCPFGNQPAEAFMRPDAAEHIPARMEEHDQRQGSLGPDGPVEPGGDLLARLRPRYRQILDGADGRLRVEVPLAHEVLDMPPGILGGHVGHLRDTRPVQIGQHERGLRIELSLGGHRPSRRAPGRAVSSR